MSGKIEEDLYSINPGIKNPIKEVIYILIRPFVIISKYFICLIYESR